jgi:hypothetical protein
MLRTVKWTLVTLILVIVALFLHYTLPSNDIVRIVGTDTRRIDFGENSIFWASPDVGTGAAVNRDVKFIEAVTPENRVRVYRNEDTGWGWPPYFKLNSFNLQAEASNLISSDENPKWVAIKHYGWRSEFFTIFPNAVSIRRVEGPDASIFPWLNIVILSVLAVLVLMVWRMLAQLRERVVDPLVEDVGDAFDRVDEHADRARARAGSTWGRFRAWLGSFRGPPRR